MKKLNDLIERYGDSLRFYPCSAVSDALSDAQRAQGGLRVEELFSFLDEVYQKWSWLRVSLTCYVVDDNGKVMFNRGFYDSSAVLGLMSELREL